MHGFCHVTSYGYKLGTGTSGDWVPETLSLLKSLKKRIEAKRWKMIVAGQGFAGFGLKIRIWATSGRPKKFQFFGRCLLLSALVNL